MRKWYLCGTPKTGGLIAEEAGQTQEEIFEEALSDPSLTDAQRADILKTKALVENGTGGAPVTAPLKMPRVTNNMLLTPKMQETSVWCAGAMVQQMLLYIKGSSPTQQQIMNSVGSAPGLTTVLNYLNQNQSRKTYTRVSFTGEQILKDSVWNAVNSSLAPIVYTMGAPANSNYWPYPTNGHFTNIIGYNYASDYYGSWNYTVADPYYFQTYMSAYGIIVSNPGILVQPFQNIWSANVHIFTSNPTFAY